MQERYYLADNKILAALSKIKPDNDETPIDNLPDEKVFTDISQNEAKYKEIIYTAESLKNTAFNVSKSMR